MSKRRWTTLRPTNPLGDEDHPSPPIRKRPRSPGGPPELPLTPSPIPPLLNACRSVHHYARLNLIDEGTYGRVYRARCKATSKIYALKQVKLTQEREGFPVTSLREVSILLELKHENVVSVKEVVVGSSMDNVYMVMEYCEHDLKGVLNKMLDLHPYGESEVKSLMLQLLKGVSYLHENWVLHRDLKTANILMNDEGILKICDFGLARMFGDPLRCFTQGVVTLWYRAPELLLGVGMYDEKVDIWSVGCIFAELVLLDSLFSGQGELDLLNQMVEIMGTPREEVWKGFDELEYAKKIVLKKQYECRLRKRVLSFDAFGRRTGLSEAGMQLMESMLCYDPKKRISAREALRHKYFREAPRAKDPAFIQTFPEDHERYKRARRQ